MLPTLRPGPLTDLPPALRREHAFLPEGSDLSHLLLGLLRLRNESSEPADLPLLPVGGVLLLFPHRGPAQLCGVLSSVHYLTLEPGETVYGVLLQWDCSDWLWSRPMTALENAMVPLEPLLPGSDLLGPALHRCATEQEQSSLVARLLTLHGARQYRSAPLLQRCLRLIHARQGQIRVAELADILGCSERYLNRLLRQKVGLSTKTVCELRQLYRMLELLGEGPAKSLLHTAVSGGYFDQAHMNRHCRRFLGCSASTLRSLQRRPEPLA